MSHHRSALVYWPAQAKTITLLSDNSKNSNNNKAQTSSTNSNHQQDFLIGWNVRDFTIVVAAIVSCPSTSTDPLSEVRDTIRLIQSDVNRLCFSEHERAAAPFLTIVGTLISHPTTNNNNNNNNQSASSSSSSSGDNLQILQHLRSSTTAFIELERSQNNNTNTESTSNDGKTNNNNNNNLPFLRSLYTSSIKFDATLHLLCYQENLFDVRKAPLPFSPLVRLGVADVNSIIAGNNASRVLKGAQSVLEGPFLPSHALNLMPPLHPRHFAPRSVANTGSFAFPTMDSSNQKSSAISSTNDSVVSNNSSSGAPQQLNNKSLTTIANELDKARAVSGDVNSNNDDDVVEVDIKTLNPSVPPRLQFPTAASLTDLSCCRSCLSGSAYVQHRIAKGRRNSNNSTNNNNNTFTTFSNDDDEEGTSPIIMDHRTNKAKINNDAHIKKSNTEKLLNSIAASVAPIVALLLQVAIFFAKFSYTGAILEYKLRELSNVLALIQRKTTTCGLHPVLPHTLCGLKGERRTCLYAFAARQVVGDILFGFCLSWVLAFHSDSVFHFMRQFAWYGLHGMHVGYFEWFHGYPAGFKMNADLNEALFMTTNKTMQVYSVIVGFISQYVDIYKVSYLILGLISFGGASLGFSFVADCCNLATLHIRFLYHYIAFFYHALTTVTGSLLLLMRGKKRNPLKNRVDEASFEFDEVVLGTMGCCACAFLVPTVALYYLYLATCRTVVWVTQESIRGIAVLCCNAPIYPGFLWLTRRKQWLLTGGVVLANVRSREVVVNNNNSDNSTDSPKSTNNNSPKENEASEHKKSSSKNKRNNINSSSCDHQLPLYCHTMNEEDCIIEDNNQSSSSSNNNNSDVVGDVVFMSLPFMAIFRELLLLVNLLFSGTLSISRIIRFIWTADPNSKPVIDVPNKIFRHLTVDPAHPVLMRGGNGNSK